MEKRKLQDDDIDTEPKIKKHTISYDSDSDDSSENESDLQSLTNNKHEKTFLNTNKTSNGQQTIIENLPIQTELVEKWSEILANGFGEKLKHDFIRKYPIPPNFNNSRAPIMNPEVVALLKDKALRRDHQMMLRQSLLGNILACLGRTLTSIHNGETDKEKTSEQLNDAAMMTAHIHYVESMTRRKFVQQSMGKTVMEKIKDLNPDESLFGKGASEIFKEALIEKNAGNTAPLPSTAVNTTVKKHVPPTQNNPQKLKQNVKPPNFFQNLNHKVRTAYVPQKFNHTQVNFKPRQQFQPVRPWSRVPWLNKNSSNTTPATTTRKIETPEETHFPPSWL